MLSNYKLPEDRKADVDLDEQYSDPEAGVEIVDMANLGSLDVMAPRGLPKQVERKKIRTKKRGEGRVKVDEDVEEGAKFIFSWFIRLFISDFFAGQDPVV